MLIRSERIDFLNRLFIDFQFISVNAWVGRYSLLFAYLYLFVPKSLPAAPSSSEG